MKPVITKTNACTVYSFRSISDFVEFVNNEPVTPWFDEHSKYFGLSSQDVVKESSDRYKEFYQTKSFSEAEDLLVHGWVDGSQKLTAKLKGFERGEGRKELEKIIRCNDVVGFSPVVPLALQGVPNSMLNTHRQYKKQKVITVQKMACYSAYVSADEIMEQSYKALAIVKLLENNGYRCNLDVTFTLQEGKKTVVCKVRVKKASERLNVSKMAFCLAHPSMLRRFCFAFIERCKDLDKSFVNGYGHPVNYHEYLAMLENMGDLGKQYKNDLIIPSRLNASVETLSELKADEQEMAKTLKRYGR